MGRRVRPVAQSRHCRHRRLACCLVSLLLTGLAAGRSRQEGTPETLQRALALQQAGRLAEAAAVYEEFLQLHSPIPEVWSNLGAAYAGLGDLEQAVYAYRQALQLAPSNRQIRLNLCLAYYKMAEFGSAETCLLELPAARTELRLALLLADIRFRQADYDSVLELLAPFRDRLEEDSVSYLLGTALIRTERIQEGQVFVDRILRHGDSAAARFMLGTARMLGGDLNGAVTELQVALVLDPHLPGAHNMLGRAFLSQKRHGEAAAEFRSELERDANDFDANFFLGSLLHEEGNNEEALPLLKKAMKLRPASAEVGYQLGVTYLASGELPAARELLEALVADNPEFIEAHVSLAATYHRLGMGEEANRQQEIIVRLHAAAEAGQAKGRRSFQGGTPNTP